MDPELKELPNEKIKEYLLKKYDERRIVKGRLYNNSTLDNVIISQEEFINKYLNEPLILSGYSCFYENQDNSTNISSAALTNLRCYEKI